jgi:leader peptidase (prepilin peptidase)/N-methyltransferase
MTILNWLADVARLAIQHPNIALAVTFLLGAVVGCFLNVCIDRLPLQKSVFWPGSRCASCLQRIRWYHSIPIVSSFLLDNRCPTCGAAFSRRYFWIELLTGLAFAGLYYLEVIHNFRGVDAAPFVPPLGAPPES